MSDTSNKLQIQYQELDQKFREVTKEKKTIDGVVKCLEKKILILRNMRNTKTEPPVVESVPQTEPPVFPSETAFPALPVALPVQPALLWSHFRRECYHTTKSNLSIPRVYSFLSIRQRCCYSSSKHNNKE